MNAKGFLSFILTSDFCLLNSYFSYVFFVLFVVFVVNSRF
jgi:hypothetical protein